MAVARLLLAIVAASCTGGCGYIHFGRLPGPTTATGETALVEALSSLSTEHKILKQELVLARKEGDALRAALDRAGGADGSDLAARLNETARELATLRASYAKLQVERAAGSTNSDVSTKAGFSELEDKLASSLRYHTQLQEENARLRVDLDRARSENTALTAQLKTAVTERSHAEAAFAQLNTEFLAQKEARLRADQAAAAARAQLGAVIAASRGSGASPGEASADDPAAASSPLRLAKSPPAGASPTAELRANTDRLRSAVARPTTARVHVVQSGDTLESLARQYYGRQDQWARIVAANESALNADRALTPGMRLTIPE